MNEIIASELLGKVDIVLQKSPEKRHSFFQLKYFVVGKEPTTQGQLWQCLREMEARKKSIEAMHLQIEETKDEIQLAEIDLLESESLEANNIYNEKRREIAMRMKHRRIVSLKSQLTEIREKEKYCLQELNFLHDYYKKLLEIAPLRDFDDYLSQVEYYNEKLADEIHLKMLLNQPLDTEIVKTILALPDKAPIKIETLKTLSHVQDRMDKMKDIYLEQIKEKDAQESTE